MEPRRARLLDLFCGAGGAAMGYHRAGFEVVGVDIAPQPHYPFEFHQRDALAAVELAPADWLFGFDAIHASPPCQAYTVYGNNARHVRDDHPDLIEPTRELLQATGLPYVIENVPGAPLRSPIMLCGTAFPGLEVRRHRIFESNMALLALPCQHGRLRERKYPGSSNRPNGRTVANIGEWRVPLAQQQVAIDINWMTLPELSQAIPPAYTAHIGEQLMAHLEVAA
jgi:DNA (cytosine-5)-methyltransferase 1